ncbi:hypothetical protein LZ30DRAFT_284701 [Colletotrichum cereale]|nr:hypothetical protein LZ30DRAFT_284701 [Colletotrichum cereale]
MFRIHALLTFFSALVAGRCASPRSSGPSSCVRRPCCQVDASRGSSRTPDEEAIRLSLSVTISNPFHTYRSFSACQRITDRNLLPFDCHTGFFETLPVARCPPTLDRSSLRRSVIPGQLLVWIILVPLRHVWSRRP